MVGPASNSEHGFFSVSVFLLVCRESISFFLTFLTLKIQSALGKVISESLVLINDSNNRPVNVSVRILGEEEKKLSAAVKNHVSSPQTFAQILASV